MPGRVSIYANLLDIVNAALVELGSVPLTSLDPAEGDNPTATFIKSNLNRFKWEAFTAYPWSFAKKTINLGFVTETGLDFPWKSKWHIQDGLLEYYNVRHVYPHPAAKQVPFKTLILLDGNILINWTRVQLGYPVVPDTTMVCADVTESLGVSAWPAYFCKYLIELLKYHLSIVEGDQEEREKKELQLMQIALSEAISEDRAASNAYIHIHSY